jgi:peptidoglycan/LPS O-acetylase OafA/YrhL
VRLVVTKRNYNILNTGGPGAAGEEIRPDSYRERLVKYIPVEALVLYVAAYGSTYATLSFQPYFSLIARWIFLAGIAATLLWLWKVEGVKDWVQLAISTFGFVVWVFALGVVPVAELPWYNQVAAALFLPVYVFGTPLIEGIPERW